MRPTHRHPSLAAGVLGLAVLAASPAVSSERPSVLLVTIDTLRADRVGAYGDARATTPAIDRLAAEGVVFDEARAHVPLTLPSHATILTGALPPRHGVRGNATFALPPEIPTLAQTLRAEGYATAAVVSSVVLDRAGGLDRGFDVYDDNQRVGPRAAFDYRERGASQVADSVARILPGLSRPFFLWVHLYDPHAPWVAPDRFAAAHPDRPYDAEVAFADAAVGEIRARAASHAGGALVVAVTSDHGESLGAHGEPYHGYTLHRGVLRVPLVLAGPGMPRGVRVSGPVGLVDLAPTLAGLVAVPFDAADGRSLAPTWRSAGTAGRFEPIWEETLHPLHDSGWAPMRGLLTDTWHVVDAPIPELYDRRHDPDDETNLAARQPRILARLLERLRARAGALGDPQAPAPGSAPDSAPDGGAERRERLARLASLGYVSAAVVPPPDERLDPKEGLGGVRAIEAADLALARGDVAGALSAVEPWVDRDPTNPRLWHQLGRVLARAGEHERAARALDEAERLAPGQEFIAFTRVDLLLRRGLAGEARARLERILERNPRAVDATLQLVRLAAEAGDDERAAALLRRSYEAGVRDPELLDRLGYRRLRAGRPAEALRHFREALELWPGDPVARLEVARAALREGDASEAIELLGGCVDGSVAFACRIELARAWVVGPRDLTRARAVLLSARRLAGERDELLVEVDRRLTALDGMWR